VNIKPNEKLKIPESEKTLVVSDEKQLDKLEKIAKGLNKKSYMYMQPNPMLKVNDVNKRSIGIVSKNLTEKLDGKRQVADIIDRIFIELIEGAYQDRMVAYSISAEDKYSNLGTIQSIRQRADNHLARLIKAYTDLKKPPVKVSVRNLDQMNISDKQINISGKNANDLDKK
jgi:hypothetical protein